MKKLNKELNEIALRTKLMRQGYPLDEYEFIRRAIVPPQNYFVGENAPEVEGIPEGQAIFWLRLPSLELVVWNRVGLNWMEHPTGLLGPRAPENPIVVDLQTGEVLGILTPKNSPPKSSLAQLVRKGRLSLDQALRNVDKLFEED